MTAIHGHTAVRLSQLAELAGDERLMARARSDERLIVLRGKQDINPESARQILVEGGLIEKQ